MTTTSLLAVPLKFSGDVDLIKPIKTVIGSSRSFTTADTTALTELHRLREKMVLSIKNNIFTDDSLEAMQSYYDQLGNLEVKIPFSEAKVYFKWVDAFDKKSWLSGKPVSYTCHTNLLYEKACVLFNIAAIATQIAKTQELDGEEGLKKATKMLQLAAGIFSVLTAPLPQGTTEHKPTPDLYPEALAALAGLCLAQAQEMILKKVIKDNKKNNIVAKVAAHAEDLYLEAGRMLENEKVKVLWEREWLSTVANKRGLYSGLAQLHQAKVCKEAKNIGEEISRLRHTVTLLTNVEAIATEWKAQAEKNLQEANKDNDFIYHEVVPAVEKLPAIERAAVARMTPLPDKFLENGRDYFQEVPNWGEGSKKSECVIS